MGWFARVLGFRWVLGCWFGGLMVVGGLIGIVIGLDLSFGSLC